MDPTMPADVIHLDPIPRAFKIVVPSLDHGDVTFIENHT
jgi:hypothetical protein